MTATPIAGADPNVPAARLKRTEIAAPSRSEARERRVTALVQALGHLSYAGDTFNRERCSQALDAALALLGTPNTEAGIRDAMESAHQVLRAHAVMATREQVAEAVACLVGAFPNFGNKTEARLYGRALSEDIAAAEPTAIALSMTVRHIRRTSRFMPSIAEVLSALDAAERRIAAAWDAIELLPERWASATARLARLSRDHEQWLAGQVAAYRRALASGGDLRHFPAEVVAAARPPDEENLF